MKERPILFNAEMVRLILEGKKTQTRRIIKPEPPDEWNPVVEVYAPTKVNRRGEEYPGAEVFGAADEDFGRPCPYGQPGDHLWVRETIINGINRAVYAADRKKVIITASDGLPAEVVFSRHTIPSIHMPRWASRITLEIKDVRVERIKDISSDDCVAEGIPESKAPEALIKIGDHKWAFKNLWESINGPMSFLESPWVWVIEFKRIKP